MNWLFSIINYLRGPFQRNREVEVFALLAPFVGLIFVGTIVYSRLEDWTLLEALYATIITITTVGYGDFSPQTEQGRIFAIFFTLVAIGLAGYAISTFAAAIFDGREAKLEKKRFQQRMNKISQLKDHIIICGASVMGIRAAGEFRRRGVPFVILEADEGRLKRMLLWNHTDYVKKRQAHYATLEAVDWAVEERKSIDELAGETGILYLLEDPTQEQHLRQAGIDSAYGVVSAMEDDRDSTTIILSARDMAKRLNNGRLRIVASALDESHMHMLYLAGADRVISPLLMGGFTLASNMLDHDAAEFWDQMLWQIDQKMRVGDIKMADFPQFIGRTVEDLRKDLAQMVIAIRRNNEFIYTPEMSATLNKDDVLIVMGPNI